MNQPDASNATTVGAEHAAANGAAQQQALIRTVVPLSQGMIKVVWTKPNGAFVGDMIYTASGPDALRTMALDFARFAAEATSSIVRAGEMPLGATPAQKLQ